MEPKIETETEKKARQERNSEIAKTIMQQLGNKLLFMVGAKYLASIDNGLSFKIECRGAKFNYLSITLNASDTYDMHFQKIRANEIKDECKLSDIYVDQLREIISDKTGLTVSL